MDEDFVIVKLKVIYMLFNKVLHLFSDEQMILAVKDKGCSKNLPSTLIMPN